MPAAGGLPDTNGCVVLVPVKSFSLAKARLSPTLTGPARAELARRMAAHVLQVAAPLPTAVVCDDDEVARWAAAQGAQVLMEPGRGLNGAVTAGVDRLAEAGAQEVIVAHGDLPLAEGFAAWAGFAGVTIVPDLREDGTPVLCVPARAGFRFAYGPGSFGRHVREAGRLGLPTRIVREPGLRFDVDLPDDVPAVLGSPHRP